MKFNSMQLKPSSFESNVKLTEDEIEDWKGRVNMSMNLDMTGATVVPGEIQARIVKDNATKSLHDELTKPMEVPHKVVQTEGEPELNEAELMYIESDDWFQLAFVKSEFDAIIEEFKEPFEKYMAYGVVDGKLVIDKDRRAYITLVGNVNGVEVKFGGGNVKTIDELITMLEIMALVNVDAQYISTLSESERDDLYFSNKETVLVMRDLKLLSYIFMH